MRAFIFDTETSGLVKNSLVPLASQPRIIELFGHLVEDETGEVIDEIEFMCHPGIEIEAKITQITGIRNEDLKDKPPFADYAPQLLEMISRSDSVVAHNLSFDMALVEADCLRCSMRPAWPPRLICLVEQSEWIRGHRLKLGDLHEELFGEPFAGAHRARSDVEALTKCFMELKRRGDL